MNSIKKHRIRVENLGGCEPNQISGIIRTLTEASAFRYPAFFVNQEQGRGIDFPTNQDIESSGGVHVIIAQLPETFLEFQ